MGKTGQRYGRKSSVPPVNMPLDRQKLILSFVNLAELALCQALELAQGSSETKENVALRDEVKLTYERITELIDFMNDQEEL